MRRGRFIEAAACTAVIGLMLIAFSSSSVNADQPKPPRKGCVAVSKDEYNSAKRQKLLRDLYGSYLRTGRLLKHYYWYCH